MQFSPGGEALPAGSSAAGVETKSPTGWLPNPNSSTNVYVFLSIDRPKAIVKSEQFAWPSAARNELGALVPIRATVGVRSQGLQRRRAVVVARATRTRSIHPGQSSVRATFGVQCPVSRILIVDAGRRTPHARRRVRSDCSGGNRGGTLWV